MDSTTESRLKLSVVLSTYNRAETLRRTLDHLVKQSLDPRLFEVIVIDDGSPDDTRRVVDETIDPFPARLTYLHHENRGPGYTQNRGIRAASARLILLMADDIWLSPGALEAHLAFHEANPEPHVAVLGKVLQSPELKQSVFLRNWDQFGFKSLDGERQLPYYMFWVCNLSVKRDFLLEHEMFRDERGRGGAPAHEDVELGFRLRDHGLRILYNEAALGHHYHLYTLDQAIQRYYDRGVNWGEFRRLVPDPEYVVHTHLLNFRTLPDYIRVLRGSNSLRGRERHLSWHILRQLVRVIGFNRITVRWIWRPVLDRAECSRWLARLMTPRLYQIFLFQQFSRGVRDGRKRFGE